MMYEYYVDAIDGNDSIDDNTVEDEECGENKMTNWQKELIALVKANPPLWDKRQTEYCGKNFKKDLAWASVASALKDVSANISGIDAEKEFYKIRQKYGKERRKMIISMKGKSGQSAQSIYIPKWELYGLCDSFLRPVIIESNDTADSDTPESAEMFFHSQKQHQAQIQPHLQSQSSCTFEIRSSPPKKDVNTVQQILQTMTKTTANMQVPPPDSFTYKKIEF